LKTVDCKFCGGARPVDPATHRCKGCGMEEGSCRRSPEPSGRRPCPMCDCRVVRWINDNTQLECVVCHTEFEAVEKGIDYVSN